LTRTEALPVKKYNHDSFLRLSGCKVRPSGKLSRTAWYSSIVSDLHLAAHHGARGVLVHGGVLGQKVGDRQ